MAAGVSYRELFARLKKCPELLATLSIPITDILGDRPDWVDTDGEMLGRNTRLKAQKFWAVNNGKETIREFLFDAFLTGDAYLWLGKPSKEEQRKAFKEAFDRHAQKYSPFLLKEIEVKAQEVGDSSLSEPQKFMAAASSTIRIINDGYEVLCYEQVAPGGTHCVFSTDEMKHFRYLKINGEVQGFAPAQALMAEIVLLWLVKGNMTSFMQNGGSPDKVFVLPMEMTQSPNYRHLIETLRKYKSVENRHGSLVFTGDLKIEDLQGSPKDLEYKDLALYITSNIAFAYGIPVTRIPYLIGSASSKGDSGGLSEAGYWNRISDLQDTLEDFLNFDLFGPLGWHIKFDRKYKQDEIREAQVAQMQADTTMKLFGILGKVGVQLTQEKALTMLGLHDEDVEELSEENKMQMFPDPLDGTNRQNVLPKSTTMKEPDKNKKDNAKRNVANSKVARSATNDS